MVVSRGEQIFVDIDIEATIVEPALTLGIAVRDREGKLMYGVNSLLLGKAIRIEKPGPYRACIQLNNPLGLGAYSITLALHKDLSHISGCYHWFDSAAAFAVSEIHGQPFEGIVDCRADIFMLESPSDE
jgi:lipopolysaccharide transport system ATP-binding protein